VQHGLQDFFLNNARDHRAVASYLQRGVELVADGKALRWYREAVRQRVEMIEPQLAGLLREAGSSV
jgi:hypothetical protein